jgi:hypothetical protein
MESSDFPITKCPPGAAAGSSPGLSITVRPVYKPGALMTGKYGYVQLAGRAPHHLWPLEKMILIQEARAYLSLILRELSGIPKKAMVKKLSTGWGVTVKGRTVAEFQEWTSAVDCAELWGEALLYGNPKKPSRFGGTV